MTILMNIFDVLPEDEQAFMDAWDYSLPYFSESPGFVKVRLHREARPRRKLEGEQYYDDPDSKVSEEIARIRFFNYVEWESPEAFENAAHGDGYLEAVDPLSKVAIRTPQLFEVLRNYPEN